MVIVWFLMIGIFSRRFYFLSLFCIYRYFLFVSSWSVVCDRSVLYWNLYLCHTLYWVIFPFSFSDLFPFLSPPVLSFPVTLHPYWASGWPLAISFIVSTKFYRTNAFHSCPFLELIKSFASGGLAIKFFISTVLLLVDYAAPSVFEFMNPSPLPRSPPSEPPGGASLGVCWCSGSASPPVNTESPAACPSPPGAAPGPWGLPQAPFGP